MIYCIAGGNLIGPQAINAKRIVSQENQPRALPLVPIAPLCCRIPFICPANWYGSRLIGDAFAITLAAESTAAFSSHGTLPQPLAPGMQQ